MIGRDFLESPKIDRSPRNHFFKKGTLRTRKKPFRFENLGGEIEAFLDTGIFPGWFAVVYIEKKSIHSK